MDTIPASAPSSASLAEPPMQTLVDDAPANALAFDAADGVATEVDAAFQATCEARDRFWTGVGQIEPDLIGYLISPELMGDPAWPTTRQAFRVVRRERSVIVATDGLSDPFQDLSPAGNGFEMELFVETESLSLEVLKGPGVEAIKTSWPFALVEHVARVVADFGGVRHNLDEMGVISLELPGLANDPLISEQVPARFIDGDTLSVLIGVPTTTAPESILDAPNAPVRVSAILLLTAAELQHVRSGEEAARRQILAHLAAHDGHICSLERPSAV
jgi:hypothetical protein